MKTVVVFIFSVGFFLLYNTAMFAGEKNVGQCLKWKRVCYQKEHCIHQTGLRTGCYRCLKPAQKGFHLYLRQIDRGTCNIRTVEYLRTMGYRCYNPDDADPCSRTPKSEYCDWRCVKYAKQ
ncbi:MAG: hypothetical protein COY58_07835 [Gammaproteobacteria bacterium CG_4_10_14_0_8_um_filter_38_16]|nr:MAG: hypothetical protein COY58_07835 [Gammaproteobacteria bacterium CG_4_10_14_0_8_um_filter_38_16]PJA03461.1 MAG: hypothetical protein COX72_05085 [Gammaproteobacteria bacterium CG_4_10_14_0_2_um_filter_38_22]PJB10616.1 MAG: hypothetical protein CO120_03975 [Gammaproteobacteria bacterium CG_4_9_14_3_um_filter_38_9]